MWRNIEQPVLTILPHTDLRCFERYDPWSYHVIPFETFRNTRISCNSIWSGIAYLSFALCYVTYILLGRYFIYDHPDWQDMSLPIAVVLLFFLLHIREGRYYNLKISMIFLSAFPLVADWERLARNQNIDELLTLSEYFNILRVMKGLYYTWVGDAPMTLTNILDPHLFMEAILIAWYGAWAVFYLAWRDFG